MAWKSLERLVAVIAGTVAGGISLGGLGIDSFIEVTIAMLSSWREIPAFPRH